MNTKMYQIRTAAFVRIMFMVGGAAIAITLLVVLSVVVPSSLVVLSVVVPSSQRASASHSGWVHETSEYHSGAHNSIHHMSGDTRVIGTTASYLYADIIVYHTSDTTHGRREFNCTVCTRATTGPVTFSGVLHSHRVIYSGCGKTSDGHVLPNNGGPQPFHDCTNPDRSRVLAAWGCASAEKPLRCGMMRVSRHVSDPLEGASPRWTVAALVM